MPPREDETARWVRQGRCEVSPAKEGMRFDAFLARTFPYRSRSRWVRLVRAGRILINDSVARPGRLLRAGDRIDYVPDPRPEPKVSRAYRVLYEDEALLAVCKPAHLPVHPSGRYYRNTLLMMLLAERGEDLDATELRIVHRLDRETSGIILFAKGREAAAALSSQFENREARKRYLAIVHGAPRERSFVVDAPLARDPLARVRKTVVIRPDGRPARTGVRLLRSGNRHSLVAAIPYTGRLHQIRVHLRHAGHPILGDKVYGLDPDLFLRFVAGTLSASDRDMLGWPRQALHAWRLAVRHPATGRRLSLRAPVGGAWLRKAASLGLR